MPVDTFEVQQPAKQLQADLDDVQCIHIRRVAARRNDEGEITTPAKILLRVFLSSDVHADCEASDLTAAQRTSLVSVAKAIATVAINTDPRINVVGS